MKCCSPAHSGPEPLMLQALSGCEHWPLVLLAHSGWGPSPCVDRQMVGSHGPLGKGQAEESRGTPGGNLPPVKTCSLEETPVGTRCQKETARDSSTEGDSRQENL